MVSIRRKILFSTFLTTFFIATISISLYATGYKLDLKHPFSPMMIQKTGMIIFKTEPEGATIYINEKEQEELLSKLLLKKEVIKTPAKIKGLLHGEYNVKLELDGYWPWNKKIRINSGQISHAQNIKLFKKDLPMQIVNTKGQDMSYSPNKKKVFLKEANLLVDLKTEEKIEIPKSEKNNILWSEDNKKLIIGDTIFDIKNTEKTTNLSKLIGANIKNPKWDKNNTNKLYYIHKNSLNCFNFTNNENKNLIDNQNILDFLIKDGKIITISKERFKTILKLYSLEKSNLIKEIEVPFSENYKLINKDHDLINLYDKNYSILYLINPFSLIDPLEEIISNVKYTYWVGSDNLLYANDFEVWSFDLTDHKKNLLTRISDKITGVIKAKKSEHIIYFTNKSIEILELGEYDKIQVTRLIDLDRVSDPALSESEDVLYFYAKIGNQEGLYKLDI